jgi:hypothetical protein
VYAVIFSASVVMIINAAIVIIGPAPEVAAAIAIWVLNVASASMFGNDARTIATLDYDSPLSLKAVMNYHSAVCQFDLFRSAF